MIHLEESQIVIVKTILKKFIPNYKVMVFGSRATGKNIKKFSDLDLCILDEKRIDRSILLDLRNAFSESLLPIKVDIILWSEIDQNFKSAIEPDFLPLV